jgi:dipeptidyl aminopeptidase/acylaminoacyl peptidase
MGAVRLAPRALAWPALAALLACLGAAAVVWRGSQELIHAGPPAPARGGRSAAGPPPDPESAAGLYFESVRFRSAGGSELDGWLVPTELGFPYAIAFVHGAGQDRRAFLDHLLFLNEVGYALLLFDLRDHGASDGAARGSGLGYRELHDVSAAVRYLRERGYRRVAAHGISLGGSAVLLAAAGDRAIDVVIAEAPLASIDELARARLPRTPEWLRRPAIDLALLRVGALGEPRPIDVVGRIAPTPLVLIGSAADRVVPAASVETLYAAAREPKELWIAARGEHGAILEAEPEEYRRRLLTYLGRWLAPHTATPPARPAAAPAEAAPAP